MGRKLYFNGTKSPRDKIQNHYSGYGSYESNPSHQSLFAVMAFIGGFAAKKELRLNVCNRENRNKNFTRRRNKTPHEWELCYETAMHRRLQQISWS